MRVRSFVVAAFAVVGFGLPVVSVEAAVRPAVAAEPVVLDGHGNGHGIGLSQWGAYGYAVDKGWSADQILGRYYSGTVAGTVPLDTMVRVRLQHFDGAQTAVSVETGTLVVPGLTGTDWKSVLVREAATNGVYSVWARTDLVRCPSATNDPVADGWTLVEAAKSGPLEVRTAANSLTVTDLTQLLAACEPDGTLRWYRGTIRALNDTSGNNRTVNVLPMEHYLRTVIAMEMSPGWASAGGGKGAQALQAQAIAARSFALAHQWYTYADVCDMICQSYFGVAFKAPGATLRAVEHPATDAAVLATAGVVRRVGSTTGAIALTMFSASNGGYTAPGSGALQPFAAVPDEGDSTALNRNHNWTVSLTPAAISAKYPAIGVFSGITVLTRNGYGEWGGRVLTLRLTGSKGSQVVTGAAFRTAMGLKDTWFNVRDASAPVDACAGRTAPVVTGPLSAPVATKFSPQRPVRLVDTAHGLGSVAAPLGAGCTMVVDPGLVATARSVEVSLTTLAATANGVVSAWACGSPQPVGPAVQVVAGRTVSSIVVVPLAADGTFCMTTTASTDLLVDLFGTYGTGSGLLFQPIAAVRLFDSRGGSMPAAGKVRTVQVAGTSRVPLGATAASLTIHATGAATNGVVTAYACDEARPAPTTMRVTSGVESTVALQVHLSAAGRLCLYVNAAMHLTVDVNGWFGAGATTSYFAVNGVRFLDADVAAGQARAFGATGVRGIATAATVKALAGRVTATNATSAGYLTVYACTAVAPPVSMVRMAHDAPATTSVVGVDSANGRWCVSSSTAAHVAVDVVGWYA